MEAKVHSNANHQSLPDQIVILGISPRSGTHFLYQLIGAHPDCFRFDRPIGGNFLAVHLGFLAQYAQAVYENFRPHWGVEEAIGPPDVLLRCLGDGIASFLMLQDTRNATELRFSDRDEGTSCSAPAKRLLTKAPGVKGLPHFFRVFPRAQLIILLRDGRSVVESGVRSFNWPYEWAMRSWEAAARTILEFDDDNRDGNRKYMIVRYEDLYRDSEEELRKIFTFLGLRTEVFDFEAAKHQPVIGSSELAQREGKVHWKPVEKPADFDPNRRWSHWSDARHDRFIWIAGEALSKLGYPAEIRSKSRLLWIASNMVVDLRNKTRLALGRMLRAVGLGALPRMVRGAGASFGALLERKGTTRTQPS